MPTVSTAVSVPAISRDTTVCSRITVAAAITTGSTVVSGREPWPPLPCNVIRIESVARERRPRAQREHARGQRGDVLAQHDVRAAEPVVEPVVDHRPGARAELLGGLEHREQRAGPGVPRRRQLRGGADQAADVHVVAAGVGDRDVVPVAVDAAGRAGVLQAGVLQHRQGVHVGPEQGGGPGAVAQHADDAGAADALGGLEARRPQPLGGDPGGAGLLERQLRVLCRSR